MPVDVGDPVSVYSAAMLERWARSLARPPLDTRHNPAAPSLSATPTWLQLPVWLDAAWHSSSAATPDPRMVDVLWSQYALFLYIRMQDDLLDGHVRDLELQFVADRFLIESLESLDRANIGGAALRAFYRECMDSTVNGILEVRRLESTPGRATAEHVALHARVSGIFRIGVAAVCHMYDRTSELDWLSRFQDRLAVFSQVCDDLQDVRSDLAAARFTFVGNTLIGATPGAAIAPDEVIQRLADGLLDPRRTEPVMAVLERAATDAAAVVPRTAPAPVRDLAASLADHVNALRQHTHEVRVHWLLGDPNVAMRASAASSG